MKMKKQCDVHMEIKCYGVFLNDKKINFQKIKIALIIKFMTFRIKSKTIQWKIIIKT